MRLAVTVQKYPVYKGNNIKPQKHYPVCKWSCVPFLFDTAEFWKKSQKC